MFKNKKVSTEFNLKGSLSESKQKTGFRILLLQNTLKPSRDGIAQQCGGANSEPLSVRGVQGEERPGAGSQGHLATWHQHPALLLVKGNRSSTPQSYSTSLIIEIYSYQS